MFCNYCREVNPNDAVYCCACGRQIGPPLRHDDKRRLEEAKETPTAATPAVAQQTPASGTVVSDTTNSTRPSGPDSFSAEELERLDDQELDELWSTYAKLQIPPSLAVQREIKRRALLPRNTSAPIPPMVQDANRSISPEFNSEIPPTAMPAPKDWMEVLNTKTETCLTSGASLKSSTNAGTSPATFGTNTKFERDLSPALPVGVFRDGKKLFVSKSAQFPAFCIKCGQPARTKIKKTIYWHSSWLIVFIFLGLLPYIIAVLVARTNMVLMLPLCASHEARYKNGRRIALITLLAAGILLITCIYLPEGYVPITLSLGLIGVLASGIIWEIASSLLRADLIDAEKGIFRRAGEQFLRRCPPRPS